MTPLREELSLYEGAPAADGAPTWSLHDPVRNLFFRIDWLTFEILARWSLGKPEAIADAVSRQTTLQTESQDVEDVQRFVVDNQLCQAHDAASTAAFVQREQASHQSVWQSLMHHYLFFRIPLWRCDRWLTRNVSRVSFFFSARFFVLTAIALVLGLFASLRQWDLLRTTLVDRFSLSGLMGYAGALIFVKFLHELGHGFTAKRKECRVPTMGVAFLVMWPVAYTDVNEVWKLRNSRDRFAVGAAGIVTELVIAAWATLAWALLPDGTMREVAFLLATTTWISTIAINLSPFMRFDGYFLLSDLLDFPNLHPRAFALARWHLREKLFGLGEPVPEPLPPARQRGLIIFAWLVWLYRLTLFLSIAVLVYHFFIKLLGIVLFAVEIGYFVALPVWREVAEWRKRGAAIRRSPRLARSLIILAVVLLIGWAPWNTHVTGQGVMRTSRHLELYAPQPGRLSEAPRANGTQIKSGDLMMAFESPELEYRSRRTQANLKRLDWQLEVSGLNDQMREKQSITREELAGARTELMGLERQRERLALHAPFDGILVDVPPELEQGVWVNRQEKLGELIDPTAWRAEVYLEDSEVHRVKVGDRARFYPEAPGLSAASLRVTRIDPDATRQLPEPMLAVQHGGQILTRERNNQLIPDKALYRVVLEVDPASLPENPAAALSARGRVVIHGEARSWLADYLRSGLNVLIRESGW